MRALKNISHHSTLSSTCLPWKISTTAPLSRASLPPLSLSLRCVRVSRCCGTAALVWPQHKQATMWKHERPSTRRHNGTNGPSHGRTSAAGPTRVAPWRIWLPFPVVWALPRLATLRSHHRRPAAYKRRRASILASILPSGKEMLRYAKSVCWKCMFEVFQMFYRYVASVSYGCYKVDWNVAYVTSVSDECCKRLFKMFPLF
jgi:hypothetical protein